jgi:hypothetical protein
MVRVALQLHWCVSITPPRSTAASTGGCTPPQPIDPHEEVARFRRLFRLYGRAEHRRQVVPQLILERLAGCWREHDGVHETAQRFGRASDRLSGSWSAFASSVTFVL